MKLNYKIGNIVHPVDIRNIDLQCDNLLGLSMTKEFRPSTSNIVGTDLSKYKIVGFNHFAVDFMSAIRVHKMPIALNQTGKDIIVSPAYGVFAVNDENVVLPEFLMLWFRRPAFDRYADFKSDSAIRGGYDWNELCETEIDLPPISEQRKIVNDYQVITDRIELLRKTNENLEEQASLCFETTLGQYISDGINESDNIPSGWYIATVGDFCKANAVTFSGIEDVLLYLDTGSITNNYVSGLQSLDTNVDDIPSRARRKVFNGDIVYSTVRPNLRHYGIIYNPPTNMIVSTGFAVMSMVKDAPISSEIIYMWLTRNAVVNVLQNIAENSVSTYPSIVSEDLEKIKIIVPPENECIAIGKYYKSVFHTIDWNNKEINKLERLAELFTIQLVKGA